MRRLVLSAVTIFSACAPVTETTQVSRSVVTNDMLPPMQAFTQRRIVPLHRSNAEIQTDILDLTFSLESGRMLPTFTRFDSPVGVRVTGPANKVVMSELRDLINRLRTEAGIDIFLTQSEDAAITIDIVPQNELRQAMPTTACFVVPRVSSWQEYKAVRRTATLDWTTLVKREKATVMIPLGASPQELRDCLHEELAQALGPLNDLYRLSDSVFNDDNMNSVLTAFDMLVLRVLYSDQISNGMTRARMQAALPRILAQLNPDGQRAPEQTPNPAPREWLHLIEASLSPTQSTQNKLAAVSRAITLAHGFDNQGMRIGLSYFILGRLQMSYDTSAAKQSFVTARDYYNLQPQTRIQQAHIAVQLAALAVSERKYERALTLVQDAIPIANRHENASVLATLMMIEARALYQLERYDEAKIVHMDSLAWARYGYGSEVNVRARWQQIEALDQS